MVKASNILISFVLYCYVFQLTKSELTDSNEAMDEIDMKRWVANPRQSYSVKNRKLYSGKNLADSEKYQMKDERDRRYNAFILKRRPENLRPAYALTLLHNREESSFTQNHQGKSKSPFLPMGSFKTYKYGTPKQYKGKMEIPMYFQYPTMFRRNFNFPSVIRRSFRVPAVIKKSFTDKNVANQLKENFGSVTEENDDFY